MGTIQLLDTTKFQYTNEILNCFGGIILL
jgi:hypothetical protein